jgi:5-methylcytosine-specific restriction endonuclease McrA
MNKSETRELFKEPTPTGSILDQHRVLVLNADFRPFFYAPLSTAHWQQVMFLYVKGEQTGIPRFNVVEYYPDVFVHGGINKSGVPTRVQLPSVIAHREYRPPPTRVPMTKYNVFLRDEFTCQYSGEKCRPSELSWDHVKPRANGGGTSWDNIVSAKQKINELKDDMTVAQFEKAHGYKLRGIPRAPTWGELYNKGKKYPPRYLHESWHDYLYWDTELVD